MRVLQVHNRYRFAGGEDTAVENERVLLVEAGHEVDTYVEDNPDTTLLASAALARSTWNAPAAQRVLDHARHFQPDVIHVHNTWFALTPAVFPALHRAGFPVIATVHNYRPACLNAMLYRDGGPCQDCVGKVPWRGVVRRCYRQSIVQSAAVASSVVIHRGRQTWRRDIDVVVALTRFAADLLVKSGVPAESIEVKANMVPDPGARTTSPRESDRLLYVGRLAEEKGVTDLLEGWRQSSPSGLRLDVIGDGPLSGSLISGGGVSIRGVLAKQEVVALMMRSRALVVPSRWYEGQPMVILEALASGLPVVVPDLGALPEIVSDGGLVFRAGDRGDMVDKIVRLRDDHLAAEVGAAARRQYETRYSNDVGLSRLEAIYSLARERAQR